MSDSDVTAELLAKMRRELGPNASSKAEIKWLLAERRRMNAETTELTRAEALIVAEMARRRGVNYIQRFPS